MCSANPSLGPLHTQVFHFARELSDGLKPQTAAYAEIWLDQKQVVGEAVKDVEPLYGEYYLPRKFKIAIAVPPYNDVDVFCHDLGYIAILDDDKQLLGFNVTIGGGMGVTQCVSLRPHDRSFRTQSTNSCLPHCAQLDEDDLPASRQRCRLLHA